MGTYDRIKIKYTDKVCKILGVLAGISLIIGTVVMIINIAIRPFGGALRFVYDVAGLSAAFAASLSIPYCALKRNHTVMDIVLAKLPDKARKCSEAVSGVISTAMLGLIVYAGGKYAWMKSLIRESTSSSGMPTWIFRWVWFLGMAIMTVAFILETIDFIREVRGETVYSLGDELPEAEEADMLSGGEAE